VSPNVFAICFLLGSGVVAIWADQRFPELAPRSMRGILLHIGATLVAAQLLAPIGIHLLTGSAAWTLAGVFVLGFPALTYSLLVALWVLKTLQSTLRGRFR
jgi:hypothetical protein